MQKVVVGRRRKQYRLGGESWNRIIYNRGLTAFYVGDCISCKRDDTLYEYITVIVYPIYPIYTSISRRSYTMLALDLSKYRSHTLSL